MALFFFAVLTLNLRNSSFLLSCLSKHSALEITLPNYSFYFLLSFSQFTGLLLLTLIMSSWLNFHHSCKILSLLLLNWSYLVDFNFYINNANCPFAIAFLSLLDTFDLAQLVSFLTHTAAITVDLLITHVLLLIFCLTSDLMTPCIEEIYRIYWWKCQWRHVVISWATDNCVRGCEISLNVINSYSQHGTIR